VPVFFFLQPVSFTFPLTFTRRHYSPRRFVFCDGGTKKHPKIYGYASSLAASRAFDILTCRRALEKGRNLSEIVESGQSLGTNHPLADYDSPELVALLGSVSRDDLIYGLKQVAKRNLAMTSESMLSDLKQAITFASREAEDRSRLGEPRQSYAPSAPGGSSTGERKRRSSAHGGRKRKFKGEAALTLPEPGALHLGAATDLSSLTPILGTEFQQNLLIAQVIAAGTQGIIPGLTNPLVSLPMSELGAHSLGVRPPGGQEGERAASSPPNALSFVQELCRSLSQSLTPQPELSCAADLLQIWDAIQQGRPWEKEESVLPAHLYRPHVDAIKESTDLESALTVCHDLWQRRVLHELFSLYVSTLASQQMMLSTAAAATNQTDQPQNQQQNQPQNSNLPEPQSILQQAQAFLAAQNITSQPPGALSTPPLSQALTDPNTLTLPTSPEAAQQQVQNMQLQNIFYTLQNGDGNAGTAQVRDQAAA
jgi:hypothetical protein